MLRPPLTPTQVRALLLSPESERLERKSNLRHPERIRDTICAFANDLDGTREPGVLLIGADDQGRVLADRIPDETLRSVVDLRNNGTVLPLPVLDFNRARLSPTEEVLVLRVFPAEMPPLRASGRVLVRKGSSTVLATETEERILIEKQERGTRTWDQHPCPHARLEDLDRERFETEYVPRVVGGPFAHETGRPYEERLAALRLYDLTKRRPTYGGLLLLGKSPRDYIMGCELQYVHFSGLDRPTPPIAHQLYTGGVFELLRALERIPELCAVERGLDGLERPRYPEGALRELLVNSILHRQYGGSSPTQFYAYRNRVEILNYGGLYHEVKFEDFGKRTGYRNNLLAEAMKGYGLICRFGEGIPRVVRLLLENGNPEAEFDLSREAFSVVVRARQPYSAAYQRREEALRKGLTWAQREHLDEELYAVRDRLEAALRARGASDADILRELEAALSERLVPHEKRLAQRREEEAERERLINEALRNDQDYIEATKRAETAEEQVLALKEKAEKAEQRALAVEQRAEVLVRRVQAEEQDRQKAEQRADELAQQRDGLAQQLVQRERTAVLDLCEAFGVELTEEQRSRLDRMDAAELAALRQHLKQHRGWPGSGGAGG